MILILVPSGRFFFHMMTRLAQMELELTIELTRAGLKMARKPGRRGGRKRQMIDSKIDSAKKPLAGGMPPRDELKISVFLSRRFTAGYRHARPLPTPSVYFRTNRHDVLINILRLNGRLYQNRRFLCARSRWSNLPLKLSSLSRKKLSLTDPTISEICRSTTM